MGSKFPLNASKMFQEERISWRKKRQNRQMPVLVCHRALDLIMSAAVGSW